MLLKSSILFMWILMDTMIVTLFVSVYLVFIHVPMKGNLSEIVFMKEKLVGFWLKVLRGYPIEKRWKIMKRRICAHEVRGTCCWALENVSAFLSWLGYPGSTHLRHVAAGKAHAPFAHLTLAALGAWTGDHRATGMKTERRGRKSWRMKRDLG